MAEKRRRVGGNKKKAAVRHKPIGERLARARTLLGYDNQTEFAKGAQLGQNRYNQYETGERRITVDAALKLRARYGITLDYIYAGELNSLPPDLRLALTASPTIRKAS